jgi:hypothetical protein
VRTVRSAPENGDFAEITSNLRNCDHQRNTVTNRTDRRGLSTRSLSCERRSVRIGTREFSLCDAVPESLTERIGNAGEVI